jgi:DnaJ family protein C protein 17
MPSDLLEHATSEDDFYALLEIQEGANAKEINSAYRRATLKAHPDKNPDDPNAVARFHALNLAYQVLNDPEAKAAYDNARAAREARRRETEKWEGARRAMKEDLERREGGALKRKREEMDAEERLQREIRRIAEENRRRREEKQERRAEEEQASLTKLDIQETERPQRPVSRDSTIEEVDRTIRVSWPREGAGMDMDNAKLESMFSRFGKIESVIIFPDKKKRLGDDQKKRLVATGCIVFKSIVGAHAAVTDSRRQEGPEWELFRNVNWAGGQEPESLRAHFDSSKHKIPPEKSETDVTSQSTAKSPRTDKWPPVPGAVREPSGDGKAKKPTFASFSFAKPRKPPSSDANGPSLEEVTMIRLKNASLAAERRKLEEQIRKEEAGED